ncbi:MAG: STAS domain-containing protein [Vicinamibacterales bacterium]
MADVTVPRRRFSFRQVEELSIVTPQGRFTAAAGEELLDWLSTMSHVGPPRVVLNVAEVTDVDSSGAEALLDAYVATGLRAGTLVVSNASSGLQRLLHRRGVLPLFEIFEDERTALTALRSRAPAKNPLSRSSLADVVLLARPIDLPSFEFIRVAALRTAQLLQGCTPLVPRALKPATTAMREVATGKVRAIGRRRP